MIQLLPMPLLVRLNGSLVYKMELLTLLCYDGRSKFAMSSWELNKKPRTGK